MRSALTKFDDIPGQLPEATVPEDADYAEIGQNIIARLNNLDKHDLMTFTIWRDILSFTDTFRTFHSAEDVLRTLSKLSASKKRSDFRLVVGAKARKVQIPDPPSSWLEFDISFTTRDEGLVGNGAGIVSVMRDTDGTWKIWMLRTWLENYEGRGHPDNISTPNLVPGSNGDHSVYEAAIIGGGHGGLGVAGRLTALNISNILFDNRPQIGDSWGHRYDSAKWHTIREYGNLPFGRTFTETDPNLLPAKRIAAAYKDWSIKYGLNIQAGTHIQNAKWDTTGEMWFITDGNQLWKARNLVLCIGPGAKTPVSPSWASQGAIKASNFQGTIIHSVNYHNPKGFEGKRGIVIGTANTAHDVAEDMADLKMDVTMVQRNPTFILPGEWLAMSHGRNYNLDKPAHVADRQEATMPNKIARELVNRNIHFLVKQNSKRFDDLEQAGFRVDRFGDLLTNLSVRFGGHYIDVGSCKRIVDGEIKVRQGAIQGLTKEGVRFEDGTEIKADLIVLATGFDHDFRKDAAEIVGSEVAGRMDEFSGPDSEGETRAYAKFAGHPHLYYGGGEVRSSRFYSQFIALQIQKESLGHPLRPYLEGRI
ncbi:hypothetical protein CKM354_000842200 [Cercospora kikuchii]|uniref:FAD/NAD(P)-binding domain-containing protein n=1 Tax=Cercospora kikuchii TaxID=84275 RepID=A0A9P3CLY6_9PEZI|nr:uncharacterized protein CKM354_000842200 [Cercospora kikuchii]GIZ45244.1 hypothetical protein CKM354_000842200 [Cercospora kikuchii]